MKASVFWAPILAFLSWGPVEGKAADDGVSWVTTNWEINRGRPFTIEWAGNQGPVDIALIEPKQEESSRGLDFIWETTSSEDVSSVVFTAPETLTTDIEYALLIRDASGSSALSPSWLLNARDPSSVLADAKAFYASDLKRAVKKNLVALAATEDALVNPRDGLPQQSGRLSTGQRVGIWVGVTIAGVGIFCGVCWCLVRGRWLRRRLLRRWRKETDPDDAFKLEKRQQQPPPYVAEAPAYSQEPPGQPAGPGREREAERLGVVEAPVTNISEGPSK